MAEVTLTSSIRGNLLSLQRTDDLVSRTNSRLSTGLNLINATLIAQSAGISAVAGVSMFAGFSDVSASVSVFDAYIGMFDSGISSVRSTAKTMGANVALPQTRQQLGIQALSFANQSERGVLSLFR